MTYGESARASDAMSVAVSTTLTEQARGTTHWMVERWDADQTRWVRRRSGLAAPQAADFARLHVEPYEVSTVHGNLITNAGWTRLMNLLTNQGGTQALDATHTRIGVGSGSTAEAYTDADLVGPSKWWQPVTGSGTLGTRTLSFSATFAGPDGNFAWNEFALDVTTAAAAAGNTVGALLFNRKSSIAQGTKAAGQTWAATAAVTFS
jgi:hypothetical protein